MFKKTENVKNNYLLNDYTWRESWVRPYESLYSVFKTFKNLNVFTSDTMAIKALSHNRYKQAPPQFSQWLYNRSCEKNGNKPYLYNSIKIVVEAFSTDDNLCPWMNDTARTMIMSNSYKHCPECDKIGYHSWMYQYRSLKYCPIHSMPFIYDGNIIEKPVKNVLKEHPSLNKLDTSLIDDVYNNSFHNITEIKAYGFNNFFSLKTFADKPITPLLDVGEEIYSENKNMVHNVREELSNKFIELAIQLNEIIKDIFRYDIINYADQIFYGNDNVVNKNSKLESLLDIVFRDNETYRRDDPRFSDTNAIDLQIFISFMEIMLTKDFTEELLYQYICEIFAYQNPFDFKRIINPWAITDTVYKKTPAYITNYIETNEANEVKLNSNYLLLRCIDDHVKYQWNYVKSHFSNTVKAKPQKRYTYKPGDNEQFNNLPHLKYIIITDIDNIRHIIRLVE